MLETIFIQFYPDVYHINFEFEMHAPCHLLRAVAAIKLVIYGLGLISKGKIASVLHSSTLYIS